MSKKLIISIALTATLLLISASHITAADYKHTTTNFRYIGDIFHEKEIDYFGGSGSLYVLGFGQASGSHHAHTVQYPDGESKVNISMYMRGQTDAQYAAIMARREAEILAHVKARREQAIAELNERKKVTPGMTGEQYADELRAINNYFDQLVAEIIESYSEAKKNVRILTSTVLSNYNTGVRIGIDMDPGESGFIRQTIASYSGSERYLFINNYFENTGGTTKHSMNIDGFINERIHVEGYAKVWNRSTVQEGDAKTGWWDTRP